MKVAVVYTLLTTAIILLLAFSPRHKNPTHLKLHRRIANNHAPFDPLVAKIIEVDVTHETNSDSSTHDYAPIYPFSGKFEDPEEYFNEEGEFNIKGRLEILFPLLDRSPRDGSINLKELEAWNLQQATDQLVYMTQKEMNEHDKDGDGKITFGEYLPRFSDQDRDRNDMTHGQAGWWKEKFVSADIEGDGYLTFTEFMDFLHPEDSQNEMVQRWFLKEKIRGMDHNKDDKLNFYEFSSQAYDNYRSNFEFENGGDEAPSADEKFHDLDLNNDSLLNEEEMRSIIQYLHPGEITYAKHYTKYLLNEADDDRDGELSLQEMLNNDHIFYNSVITDNDYDEDDHFRDEF